MMKFFRKKPSKPSKTTDAELITTLRRNIENLEHELWQREQDIANIDRALGQPRSLALSPAATRIWLIHNLQNVESELRLCPGALQPVKQELARRDKFILPISKGFS